MRGSASISTQVRQGPPQWEDVLETAAITDDIETGRFNAIRNNSSTAFATVAIELDNGTHWEARNVQPGEVIPVLGQRILITGENASGRSISTDAGVRYLSIGKY